MATGIPARADSGNAVQRFAALTVISAEQVAVEVSPDVATARAAVDAAGAALAQARGVNGFGALLGYTDQPQGTGIPNVQYQQRLAAYQLQVTLGDINAFEPLVSQARSALAQSITDELVAERTEKLKVIGLYYTAVQARVQRAAKQDALSGAEDFENEVRYGFGRGKLQRIDLLRAQVATAKARADLANTQGVDLNATDALAREIDRPVADLRELVDDTPPDATVIDPDAAVRRAMAFRPEIKSANATVAQAEAARRAAVHGLIPPVTLTGGYLNGDDGGSVVGGPMFTASVLIPLSGINGAKVRAQDAAIRTAMAHRDSVQRALAIEVGAAARSASASIIAHDATAQALDLAGSELKLAQAQFRTVPSSGISAKIATDIYNQAVSDDITALYTEVQALATLDAELTPETK
jgi:outer membrane protein TolC